MPPRNYRRVSEEDRQRIIDKYALNEDFLTTATELGIKRTTAYQIVRRYQQKENGDIENQEINAPGRKKKLDDESLDLLVMLIEDNVTITIKELNQSLREIFPRKSQVSDTTVSRALDGELISLKLCVNIPADRNSARVKQARVTYAHNMYERGLQHDRVYIDEMGYNLYTKRTYGRARIGHRANRIVGGQRGNNVTLIAAIAERAGLLYHERHMGGVTRDVFQQFFTSLDVIVGECQPVFIMDNAPCHNGLTENFPERIIAFLPPYSPFLNPIENCFSVVKSRLKQLLNHHAGRCDAHEAHRRGMTVVMLREQILATSLETALTVVTPELCASLYQKANTYLVKCLHSEDIWD